MELASERFLMSSAGREAAIRAFFTASGVATRVVATVRDMPTPLAMAREGAGVTIVPALVLCPTPLSASWTVPLDPARLRRLVVVRRAGHAPLPLAAALLKAVRSAAESPINTAAP